MSFDQPEDLGESSRDARQGNPKDGRRFSALGTSVEAAPIGPGLHIVATPIGNLADITIRALRTLAAADAVLAEDTRVTRVLLDHYGIRTPLIAYHEHNAEAVRPQILQRLARGEALALVSDAGTPLVSDPGYKLVIDVVAARHVVTALPGPSALLAGLVLSGLPTDRFFFEGFLPVRSGARRTRLAELKAVPGTLAFFESARRLPETLVDIAAVLGPRQSAVARELTKRFEEVRRGSATELCDAYAAEGPPKGEVVILVAPPGKDVPPAGDDLDARLVAAMARMSVKDAASVVSAETGVPRREVYGRALVLAADRRDPA